MADEAVQHAESVASKPTYEECLERAEACRQHARHLRDQVGLFERRAKAWEELADEADRPCPQCLVARITSYTSCFGVCASCFEACQELLNDGDVCG